MEWFSSWFNSKYYHVLYKQRNVLEAEKFINNLQKFLKKDDKLLDVACGSGRHTIYLNTLGYKTTGIDLSYQSIESAKKKSDYKIEFKVWDMRKCFKKNTYNVVLNLFTSFGYFEKEKDDLLTLKAMSNNLKKDGILIIDFLNAEKVISNLEEYEKKTINNITFTLNRFTKDGFICKNIQFTDNEEDFNFKKKKKIINLSEFTKLLNLVNMKIIENFGDYNLKKYDPRISDRLIILAKKWK